MKSYYTPNPHLLDLVVTTNYGSKPHFLFCQTEMPHFNVVTIYKSENTFLLNVYPSNIEMSQFMNILSVLTNIQGSPENGGENFYQNLSKGKHFGNSP